MPRRRPKSRGASHPRRRQAAGGRRGGGVRRARLPRDDHPGHRGPGGHEPGGALHPLQDQGRAALPDQPGRPRAVAGHPARRPRDGEGTAAERLADGGTGLRPLARGAAHHRRGSCSTNSTRSARSTTREIVALRRQSEDAIRSIIEDGVATGEFDVPDVPGTTLAVLSLCIDVARWFNPAGRRTPDEVGALYADLVLRMVRPRRRSGGARVGRSGQR